MLTLGRCKKTRQTIAFPLATATFSVEVASIKAALEVNTN